MNAVVIGLNRPIFAIHKRQRTMSVMDQLADIQYLASLVLGFPMVILVDKEFPNYR